MAKNADPSILDTNTATGSAANESSFLETLKKAAENLINLRIITTVGDAEVTGEIQNLEVRFPEGGSPGDRTVIVTNINLIDSDISSVIPREYNDKMESPIMKYHAEQVAHANATMDQKVKLIQTLLKDVLPLISKT